MKLMIYSKVGAWAGIWHKMHTWMMEGEKLGQMNTDLGKDSLSICVCVCVLQNNSNKKKAQARCPGQWRCPGSLQHLPRHSCVSQSCHQARRV